MEAVRIEEISQQINALGPFPDTMGLKEKARNRHDDAMDSLAKIAGPADPVEMSPD